MRNRNLLYMILTLILISLSIGSLTYVLTNIDLSTSTLGPISKKSGVVKVTATPKLTNLEYEFDIILNTHSTELNYDLVTISSLTNEKGQTVKPSRWNGDGPGGHHREGRLIFPKFNNQPKAFNLIIDQIGGIGVDFKWGLED